MVGPRPRVLLTLPLVAALVQLGKEPERRGDSFDTSQAEHFVTAKGLIEITGSPALVSTTRLLPCTFK
jgi:hypothetical protein